MTEAEILQQAYLRVLVRRFSAPKSANEIKALFAFKGLTITAVAKSIAEDRTAVSRVISYHRFTKRIVEKIELKYGITFNEKSKAA